MAYNTRQKFGTQNATLAIDLEVYIVHDPRDKPAFHRECLM